MKKLLVLLCIFSICGMATYAAGGETRGVGYWKNHDTERESYIDAAVALSSEITLPSSLRYYLDIKGKKTLKQHAQRQLSAMLLNIASGLDSQIWLSQGELEIIQVINASYTAGTAVGDALMEIEDAVHCAAEPENPLWVLPADCTAPTSLEVLENAKDLADEINNRELFY